MASELDHDIFTSLASLSEAVSHEYASFADTIAEIYQLCRRIYYRETNYRGYGGYGAMTEEILFDNACDLLERAIGTDPFTNIGVPHRYARGMNSLVVTGNLRGRPVAIKIFACYPEDEDVFNSDIARELTAAGICPQVLFRETSPFTTFRTDFHVCVMVMEQVTPFEFHDFRSTAELRCGLFTAIRTVRRLHHMGLVALDIKRANLGVTFDGRVVLLDIDSVKPRRRSVCDVDRSSTCCHPPLRMCRQSVALRQGNTMIDWFSILTTFLGYKMDMESYWGFDIGNGSMEAEKETKTRFLNRNILFNIIRNNLARMFHEPKFPKADMFWRTFCDLTHFFFVGLDTVHDQYEYNERLDGMIAQLEDHQ